jgi:pyruvate formate lyase activating enzyme
VIPEFNHTGPEIQDIINYTVALRYVKEVHFIPYHILGVEKYRMLGMDYVFGNKQPVEHTELEGYITYAHSK